jgi:amino acid adenylation domain-containing protein/thioester reductase-like protein
MFVRTLPLALHTKDAGSSLDFVRSCGGQISGAVFHERYPFTRVSQEYGFSPSIMYACQIGITERHDVAGEPANANFLTPGDPKFKISVFAEERDGEMVFAVQYDAALYSDTLMGRFIDTLTTALENIALKQQAPLRGVSLVSEAARMKLGRFNDTDGAAPETTLVRMFSDSVRRNPGKTALIAADGVFSYSELDRRANKVANALLALGVGREDRVGFIMRRTSRVIAAMFGILKAGCAYIPIDPDYPAERIEHVLADSGAKYILTTPETLAACTGPMGGIALDFDALEGGGDESEPEVAVAPEQLAYLLYTSGSTGKPKGVMIEHRGIANFIADDPGNDYAHALAQGDCVMMSITTLAFDMFGIETLLPLCNGLTTVLADDGTARDPVMIAELFRRTGADAIDSTPTRLLEYSEYGPLLDALRQCKVIILGGEKYPAALLARLKKGRGHNSGLFNIYGPTEISIACNSMDLSGTDHITVGPPTLNVREAVIDTDGNDLPPGIVGELLIGGRGVGRGYINRPEETAERFVTHAFPAPGSVTGRAYRSGDLARWTEDGFVEIIGRNDNQVKLRGLRIEIGEIENAISSIDGVRSCAVMIRRIRNSDHICAWYAADGALEPSAVREAVAKTLTPYMVPTAYLRMDALPKTPNGKNDLRALPEPELLNITEYEAPATALEQTICDIFAKVLELEKVGARDSFFEVGGSSLAVTRVVIEAKERALGGTDATISYADVFAHPTPRELAALLSGGGSVVTPPEQVHSEADYDYGPINELLARGTVEAFRSGARRPLGSVLLTGATGFLGAHVLRAMLDGNDGAIFCLLRKSREPAESRLKNMLFYYFEDNFETSFGGRLRAEEGDITRPETLEALSNLPIDTIINCAANVTHFAKDSSIADVNTGGVSNLIQFAMRKKARLVHISTASVAGFSVDGAPPPDSMMTEGMLYFGQNLENQYLYSKFMAERAILEAIPQGLDAVIMRVGNLMARNKDGEFQINSYANSFLGSLRAYHTLGCFPWSACMRHVELSPIDSTARAILLLADAPPGCAVFHPFSDNTFYMGDIISAMRDEGLGIEMAEDGEYGRALAEAMRDKARAEKLVSLIAYQNVARGRQAVQIEAKCGYTSEALFRRGWRWPEASADYLHRFIRGMAGLGFFGEERA